MHAKLKKVFQLPRVRGTRHSSPSQAQPILKDGRLQGRQRERATEVENGCDKGVLEKSPHREVIKTAIEGGSLRRSDAQEERISNLRGGSPATSASLAGDSQRLHSPPSLESKAKLDTSPNTGAEEPLYDDLRGRELIRLMYLDPEASATSCGYVLKTFPLAMGELPDYYALSYCWGSPKRETVITCNYVTFYVSASLKAGLDELQSLERFAGSWFWIDQLCINQADLDERSHQVKMMRCIYMGAVQTVVWLEPCDDYYSEGFELLGKIAKLCEEREYTIGVGSFYSRRTPRALSTAEYTLRSLGLPEDSDPAWDQCMTLFQNPWFTRTWVIQEAILSVDDPAVVYNSRIHSLEEILMAAWWLRSNISGICQNIQATREISYVPLILLIRDCPFRWSLPVLLRCFNRTQATDERDKIFAFLGLAAETSEGNLVENAITIAPDYSKQSGEVFRDTALAIFAKFLNLDLLCMAGIGHISYAKRHSPSWVPLFGMETTYPGEFDFILSGEDPVRQRRRIAADGGRKATLQVSQDLNSLKVLGVVINKIKWIGAMTQDTAIPRFLWWCMEGAKRLHPEVYPDINDFIEAVFVMVSRLICLEKPAVRDFWAYVDKECPTCVASFFQSCKGALHGVVGDEALVDQIVWQEFWLPEKSLFAITNTGAMLMGPSGMEIGDVVVVLYGDSAPAVLRSREDHYAFVGECYLVGWMDGEVVDAVEDGSLSEEIFLLR